MDQSESQGVSGALSQRLPTALKMATTSSPRPPPVIDGRQRDDTHLEVARLPL